MLIIQKEDNSYLKYINFFYDEKGDYENLDSNITMLIDDYNHLI